MSEILGGMQISASTLVAQQAGRVAPKATQPADAFSPLSFKQATVPKTAMPETKVATAPKPETAATFGASNAYVRPGTNIDIKV